MVEHLKVLISRAPKGDGGLNSRACYRILMVEPPKGSLSVEPPVGSSPSNFKSLGRIGQGTTKKGSEGRKNGGRKAGKYINTYIIVYNEL